MGKNIVVFSDGTGQEGGKGYDTNIYKLFNMVEDRTDKQVSFYDRGLGTGWRKVTGNISGAGISNNIKECYTFIFENYEAGDKIFLFGFSRGAATVRSLSSFIHYFGILPKSRPELIDKAYDIYRLEDDDTRKKRADRFVGKHHTMWSNVHFLGCFDTVAALGVPFKPLSVVLNKIPAFRHRFHNYKLSETVQHAYHALAIDDERETFHPVLWDETATFCKNLRQVWFCGMHSDVGGGYMESDLSDIPLAWMKEKALWHGLRIYKDNNVPVSGDVNGVMHNSREGTWERFFRQKQRDWDLHRSCKPVVHHSVLQRTRNVDNADYPQYRPWILDVPGGYEVE